MLGGVFQKTPAGRVAECCAIARRISAIEDSKRPEEKRVSDRQQEIVMKRNLALSTLVIWGALACRRRASTGSSGAMRSPDGPLVEGAVRPSRIPGHRRFQRAVRYVQGLTSTPVFRSLVFDGGQGRSSAVQDGFDKILMSLVLSYIFDPVETLLELKRVLAPGAPGSFEHASGRRRWDFSPGWWTIEAALPRLFLRSGPNRSFSIRSDRF